MRWRGTGPWTQFAIVVLLPSLTLLTRRSWRGCEHVPAAGPVLLAVNHLSYVDPFTTAHFAYGCGRLPRFLAKTELFDWPEAGRILRGAGQIPVRRYTADATVALRDAEDRLRRGECVVIYPEGTVTADPDRWPMPARTGVARLALDTGAPVVPVAQWGSQDIYDPRTRRLRLLPRRTVHYRAGPAVDLSRFAGREVTLDLLRVATETVMRAVTAELAVIRGEPAPGLSAFVQPAADPAGLLAADLPAPDAAGCPA